MYYIQRKDSYNLETVDEFTTRSEAREILQEYRIADPSAYYYLSSRCCKEWTDDKNNKMIIQPSELNIARMCEEF